MRNSTVVLVDALNLLYRAQHTYGGSKGQSDGLKTKSGIYTGAMYGFLCMLFAIPKYVGDADVIVFWEGGAPTPGQPAPKNWRQALVTDTYKQNRSKNDDALKALAQVPYIREALEILRVPEVYVPGLEADDLIGVMSKVLEDDEETERVYVYSNDRDMHQLISRKVHQLKVRTGKAVKMRRKDVVEEYGITPEQWSHWRALCGDSGDNYRSVKGIGPKTAACMIHDGLDPSCQRWSDLPPFRNADKYTRFQLKENWDLIHMSYVLSCIPRSVTYPLIPKELRKELKSQVNAIPELRRPTMTSKEYVQALARWTRFCSVLELQSFLASRRQYLQHIKVT